MNGFIYKISNNINNKVYIGKTLSSLEKRFKEHIYDCERRKMEKRPLYHAMCKYGVENFYIELVEEVSIDILSERECYWIKHYDSYNNGYNATLGGDGIQIYDYQAMVKGFVSGKSIKELAIEFKCCVYTVSQALKLANINTKINGPKKLHKELVAKKITGEFIEKFKSRKEAAIWLQNNNYTKCDDINNITAAIGRAANGKRPSAYGLKWENIEKKD